MNLYMADIPDDPREFTPWLERQLVGLHLRELAAELSAFQTPAEREADVAGTLDGLLGGQLPALRDFVADQVCCSCCSRGFQQLFSSLVEIKEG